MIPRPLLPGREVCNPSCRNQESVPRPAHRLFFKLRAPSLSARITADKLMSTAPAKPRLAIGSDHAGFPIKESIRKFLESTGYTVDDQGTFSEASVDYPDYGKAVGERVAAHHADLGIAVCGSGIGISIAANKVHGIRAALAHDTVTARLAREHNDANVLALGGRFVTEAQALEIVQSFLNATFAASRHQLRIDKITQIENDH
jgi:ribose 5-phosphate isomerase B